LSISRDGSGQSPLLIVVGSGHRVYHEYLLSLMSECARLWLLLDAEPTWEKLYITGHTVVDTRDSAVVEAAARLAGWMPVHGVSYLDNARSTQSAEAAEALGLPTTGPDAVRRVQGYGEAEPSADKYDLTFDVACVDGEAIPLCVSRQINAVFPEMTRPGHIVDAADSALADEDMTALVVAAQPAIGLRYGVTHTRVRHTARGPKVVSVRWGPRHPDVAIGTVQADETLLPLSVDVVEALTTPDRYA
jgi:hypothetical protein